MKIFTIKIFTMISIFSSALFTSHSSAFIIQWCNNALEEKMIYDVFTLGDRLTNPCLIRFDAHIQYTSKQTGISKRAVLKARNNREDYIIGVHETHDVPECVESDDNRATPYMVNNSDQAGPYIVTIFIVGHNFKAQRTFEINDNEYILVQPDSDLKKIRFYSLPQSYRDESCTCYSSSRLAGLTGITTNWCLANRVERNDIDPISTDAK